MKPNFVRRSIRITVHLITPAIPPLFISLLVLLIEDEIGDECIGMKSTKAECEDDIVDQWQDVS